MTATRHAVFNQPIAASPGFESCELGPRDVQVLANDVAVLQGSATETRLANGQRTTFRVTYMDVWVKRGDRWVIFRSRASKL